MFRVYQTSKARKKQGSKYKCGNCVDVDKDLFNYLTKCEEDSLDQLKDIEQLPSTLERVTFHSDKKKIKHKTLQIELEANSLMLHKYMSSI